jgi:hypothetical protein
MIEHRAPDRDAGNTPMTQRGEVLLMLVSPTDRHGDAGRLAQLGFRVITTSQAQSSPRQVIDAAPAAVLVELVTGFARETVDFLAQVARASRGRRISLLVYGAQASEGDEVAIHDLGVRWVRVGASDRAALAVAVCNALLEPSASNAGSNDMLARSGRVSR